MKITTFRSNIEARSFTENGDMILEGYAIVANSPGPFKMFGEEYIEVITPSAIESADISNVVLNREHDDRYVVARTTNGTLQLTKDEKGLFVRAKLSQNQVSKDLYEDVKSGLLNKMSFRAEFEAEEFVDATDKIPEFRITKLGKVYDVSVVAFPWYEDTEISARSKFLNKEDSMGAKEIKSVVETQEDVVEKQEIDYDTLATKVVEKINEQKVAEEVVTEQQVEEVSAETEEVETKEKELEGGTEVKVLEEKNIEQRGLAVDKKEMETVAFMAQLGNKDAQARYAEMANVQKRQTAFGLDNLWDNHTPGSAQLAVPEFLQNEIIKELKDTSDIMSRITITNVPGEMKFLVSKDGIKASFYADGEEAKGTNNTLSEIVIKSNRVTALSYVSKEFLNASMEQMMKMLISDFAEAIALEVSGKIFTGDGVKEPLGIIPNSENITTAVGTGTLQSQLRNGIMAFPKGMQNKVAITMSKEDYIGKYLELKDATGQPLTGVSRNDFEGNMIDYDPNVPKGTVLLSVFEKYNLNFTAQTEVMFSDDFKFDQSARTIKGQAVVGGAPLNTQAFKKFNVV